MGNTYCTYCGSFFHSTKYCPKTFSGQSNRNNLRCGYCGGRDHNTDACPSKWSGDNPVRVYDNGI